MYKILSLAYLTAMVGCNQLADLDEKTIEQLQTSDFSECDATSLAATQITQDDAINWIQDQDKIVMDLKKKLMACQNKLKLVRNIVRDRSGMDTKMDSKILSSAAMKKFGGMLEPGKRLELLYRGSKDGFSADSFHKNADNMGETISIIKTDKGIILGGYTDIPWKRGTNGSNVRLAGHKKSFLFNWNGKDFVIHKFTGASSDKEVLHGDRMTTWWEWGIMMYGNCNTGNGGGSYASLRNYEPHGGSYAINGGKSNIRCTEIEVFRVV